MSPFILSSSLLKSEITLRPVYNSSLSPNFLLGKKKAGHLEVLLLKQTEIQQNTLGPILSLLPFCSINRLFTILLTSSIAAGEK